MRVLFRFWIMFLAMASIIACNIHSSIKEPAKWIAAYTQEFVDVNESICIEATDTLLSYIDISRPLDNVFKLSPTVKGVVSYNNAGRYIVFTPEPNALKSGKEYYCRVSLSKLTGIDTLSDFVFFFTVRTRETKISDLNISIDQNDPQYAIVKGHIEFDSTPTEESIKNGRINTDFRNVESSITPTDDKLVYSFCITGIKRESEDVVMKIQYDPTDGYSPSNSEVKIPGYSIFKYLNSELYSGTQPYINIEFSSPISIDQELDGLVTIDGIEDIRIERDVTNLKLFYPENGLKVMTIRISELVRSKSGDTLGEEVELIVEQEPIPPAVNIPADGSILPDGNNLKLPFKAVNLAAVDVEIIKIYSGNVLTFLQENELNERNKLRRVGRKIYHYTVRLDKDSTLNLHQWQNFSIDLTNLIRQEPGAIYNVRLSFSQDYSLYNKVKAGNITEGHKGLSNVYWDEQNPYHYDYSYYSWEERDDPTKSSYYRVDKRMPNYNLIASNIGLIVKRNESSNLWCAVSNILTTKPIGGIKLKVYNYQMQIIGSGTTDSQGFASIKMNGEPFAVTASDGLSTTYLKINPKHQHSISHFDVSGTKIHSGIKGFIYGERGVWRPGDNIYLTLVVEDKEKSLPENHPVTMKLYTPDDRLYDTKTLQKGVDGIYAFTTKTEEDAPTGRWVAVFLVGGEKFYHPVMIETIKPNRLKIQISAPDTLKTSKDATIHIESHWLTGPPAAGLQTKIDIVYQSIQKPFTTKYRNYIFSNPLFSVNKSDYGIYQATLDSQGKASFDMSISAVNEYPGMLKTNLITRVIEASGDESLTSHSIITSPYGSYVGILLSDKYYETDQDLEFPVVSLDDNGKPLNKELSYKIYKIGWSWWWEGNSSSLANYVQSSSSEVVASGKLTTINGQSSIPFHLNYPDWGRFLIYVLDPESGHATGGVVTIDWPEWRGRGDRTDPEAASILSFSLDKKKYQVGEYATVYIPKSSGGNALVSIEDDSKVISRTWVSTSTRNETSYRFLVTEEMSPNFYVHVTLLQPHSQTVNDLPIRMYGIQGAEIYNPKSILNPVIEVPQEILPQQEFTIKVHEQDNKPMSYTLAIVDEGLLDITAFKTPQIYKEMNKREMLGIRTWDMFDEVFGAYTGQFRSILSVGGDAANHRINGKEKRFNPVVKFLGPFTLNKGTATHKVTLPMYVGSVRVMLVAAKNGSYGSSDQSVIVRSPIMLLSTLPRQLSCSDRLKLPVNVFVTNEEIENVQVNVYTEGPLYLEGSGRKKVAFGKPSEKLVDFDLVCDDLKSGKARVIITAKGNGFFASDTINIDVKNPMPELVKSEFKYLNKGETHKFEYQLHEDTQTSLSISTMPVIDFNGAFSFVENYSHYCTEQLSSRAMFMLYAREFLSTSDALAAEKALPKILMQIESRQLYSGGFVYWPGSRTEHEWVSSMAGEVLIEAKRQGFNVSDESIDKWKQYQKSMSKNYRQSTIDSDDLIQAYRLYTLALAGEYPSAQMNKLRESKMISQQALMRLAAAYVLVGRNDVGEKLLERIPDTEKDGGSYYTFSSELRDKAMALETWILSGNNQKAAQLSKEISEEFSVNCCSTQEIAFVSTAMCRLNSILSEESSVKVTDGSGNTKNMRNIKGVKNIQVNPLGGHIVLENTSNSGVFSSLTVKHKPSVKEGIELVNNSLSMDINYTDLDGKDISIDTLKQGEEFYANIRVKGENTSESMALTYSIPSGWEIWNDRLVGNDIGEKYSYTDIRDDRISWYFSLTQDYKYIRKFRVKLRAAYTGNYFLPATICEDMYKPECLAITPDSRTTVK